MNTPAFSLLHGFLGAPKFWHPIVGALSNTFPSAICHTPWLPGHGPLEQKDTTHDVPSTFDDAITWYASQVHSLSPCWTIGYSMGARLALGTAIRHPELFNGVILISVHPGIRTADERQQRIRWEEELKSLLQTDTMSPLVNDFETLPIFDTQRTLPLPILAKQRQIRLAHVPRRIAASLDALGLGHTPDMASQLPLTSLPVKIITGARDNKYTRIGNELAKTHDVVVHTALPDTGHNTILESPLQTAAIIESFVLEKT